MKKWGLRLATVVWGIGLGLLLAEGTLRFFHLAPANGVATVTRAEFDRIPGIYSPHQRLVDRRKKALPHRVTIDSLGYRGKDLPRRKRSGELRILMTGDSFVYGDFVDDTVTFPSQLQGILDHGCPTVTVVNAGLAGSTIIGQAHLIERSITLQPDLIILVYSENDVDDLAGRHTMWGDLAVNRMRKARPPLSIAYPLLRKTSLWNLGLEVRGSLRERHATEGAQANNAKQTGRNRRQRLRARYRDSLVSLSRRLVGRGIGLTLVAYPSLSSVYPTSYPSRRDRLTWLMEEARDVGIDQFNLLQPLRHTGLSDTTLYLLPHDGHPSPTGYLIAAEALAAHLRQAVPRLASCR